MKLGIPLLTCLAYLVCLVLGDALLGEVDVAKMKAFLERFNTEAQDNWYDDNVAAFTYQTNLTDYNMEKMGEASFKSATWWTKITTEAMKFDYKKLTDFAMKRQFESLTDKGMGILSEAKIKRAHKLSATLEKLYSIAKICRKGECMHLDPGISKLMATSRNYKELTWAFDAWRDQSGKKMKDIFTEYVALLNEAAILNGYADEGDRWRSWYETKDFEGQMETLYNQLKPLYQNLHAYTRRRLQTLYAKQNVTFPKSGHIPSHIMGNMWGQTWNYIYDLLEPYSGESKLDVTDELKEQGYDYIRIVQRAEQFFVSLGLKPMNDNFWNKSMLVRPTDGRQVVCHASAWDFYNHHDFRMKLCIKVNMEDLVTVHHEMGHIQYYMNYVDQPVLFRGGANHGFHEAIGDTMALSAITPKHLHSIGLLKKLEEHKNADVNFLMSMALDKLAFIPFGYMMDKFRWNVFSGATKPSEYTKHWWDLRCKYQGISPPSTRQEDDFDPGAKYHIAAFMPYIRYFVSYVAQFQFQDALCKESGHVGPLYKCDIFDSKKAGNKLKKLLSMGSSKPWPEAMKVMTGSEKLDATAFISYFQPLMDFLDKENKGHPIGWIEKCPSDYYKEKTSSGNNLKSTLFVSVLSLITYHMLA